MYFQSLDHTLHVSKQKNKKTQLTSTKWLYFPQLFVFKMALKSPVGEVRSQFIFLYILSFYLIIFLFFLKGLGHAILGNFV